jgi:hypothetical protein
LSASQKQCEGVLLLLFKVVILNDKETGKVLCGILG